MKEICQSFCVFHVNAPGKWIDRTEQFESFRDLAAGGGGGISLTFLNLTKY